MLRAEAIEDHRFSAGLAVLLLATSGIMLPMATFASTPSPSGFTLVYRAWSNGAPALMTARTQGGQIVTIVGPQWLEGSSAGQMVSVGFSGTTVEEDGLYAPPSLLISSSGSAAAHSSEGGQLVGNVMLTAQAPGQTGMNPTSVSAFGPGLGGFFAIQTGPTPTPGQGMSTIIAGQAGIFKTGEMGFAPGEMFLPFLQPSISPPMTSAVPKLWGDYFQRRSKFDIYVQILELMKRGPMTPFEVSFYGRLNHKRTKEYVEFLEQSGYLQLVTEDGKTTYVLTREGAGFLEKFRALFMGTRLVEVPAYQFARDF